ncbi:MAG: SxtJ family membrane protein [Candidatus Omnitrophica bacterium]|nr:SxtJ family membrane protein [Candidatus Omnitrophota bacterium]
MISVLEDIRNIKSGRKELREFGLTIGAVLLLISGLALWRGKGSGVYFLISGLIFIGFGAAAPAPLKPFQKVWMAFSAVIGFFMSRVILTALFYVILTPIGVLMKLFGKDVLDERISKSCPSYWRERSALVKAKESYKNQY